MRNPSSCKRATIFPVSPFATASGLMIENVRSIFELFFPDSFGERLAHFRRRQGHGGRQDESDDGGGDYRCEVAGGNGRGARQTNREKITQIWNAHSQSSSQTRWRTDSLEKSWRVCRKKDFASLR